MVSSKIEVERYPTEEVMTYRRVAAAVTLVLTAGALAAFMPRGAPSTTRTCTMVLESEVCAWVTLDGDRPLELGATIPIALIESVPLDAEMTWPPRQLGTLELPTEARTALGIDHLAINWEAHGHPPATFLAPHFDFHFYSITREAVAAIDCADESKPAAVPGGYALPDIDIPGMGTLVGLCVPLMGMHAMPAADAGATDAFDASMVVGYYGGEPIFFEPMVSRALLLERSDFALPVPAVHGLPDGVRYPAELRAEYDEKNRQYRLIATGFGAH
jgi:hypothetical protein